MRASSRAAVVCTAAAILMFAGCIPFWPFLPDNPDPAGPPNLAGYWMFTETVQEYSPDDSEKQADINVEFWRFAEVATADGLSVYEVSLACQPEHIIGYATLYEEGAIMISSVNGDLQMESMLSEDDTIVSTASVDGGSWTARRIEEPACEADADTGILRVAHQPVELADSESEVYAEQDTDAGQAAPNGASHLAAAKGSRLTLGDTYEKTVSTAPNSCTNSTGSSVDCPANGSGGHAGYVECKTQSMSEGKIQALADTVCMLDNDQIYPGALLQGAYFDGGSFVPITIPRSGGKLVLSGLALSSAAYSIDVSEIGSDTVANAEAKLLTDNSVVGTAANASYRVDTVYSSNQWAFNLGTDVKFMSVDVSASANTSRESTENTVIMQFTQVFYTVSYKDPQTATSVFKDGAAFDDPEGQIGTGNPPLYVSNVKYGRQVYFIAKSSLGSTLVEAALKGAYSGAASVTVTSGMSYKDIMSKTSITYIVRGGSADLALAPIASASPDQMYDKVKDFLSNRNAAQFSAANPGLPVAYTLRYLDDRTVAMKGLSTTYDRHDCSTYPANDFQFTLDVSDIDDDVYVWLDTEADSGKKAYTNQKTMPTLHINNWLLDDNDHTVIVKLGNGGCFNTKGSFVFRRDGGLMWWDTYNPGGWRDCGWQVDIRAVVNRRTGKFDVIKRWHAY